MAKTKVAPARPKAQAPADAIPLSDVADDRGARFNAGKDGDQVLTRPTITIPTRKAVA